MRHALLLLVVACGRTEGTEPAADVPAAKATRLVACDPQNYGGEVCWGGALLQCQAMPQACEPGECTYMPELNLEGQWVVIGPC